MTTHFLAWFPVSKVSFAHGIFSLERLRREWGAQSIPLHSFPRFLSLISSFKRVLYYKAHQYSEFFIVIPRLDNSVHLFLSLCSSFPRCIGFTSLYSNVLGHEQSKEIHLVHSSRGSGQESAAILLWAPGMMVHHVGSMWQSKLLKTLARQEAEKLQGQMGSQSFRYIPQWTKDLLEGSKEHKPCNTYTIVGHCWYWKALAQRLALFFVFHWP